MKNKILLLLTIISTCLSINAQIKIDFNNAVYTNDNYHTSGYTPYVVNLESRTNTSDISFNDNKVTIKIGIGKDDAESKQIKGTWYAAYISDISKATEESKLVCDGIYPKMKEDTYGVSGSGYGETKKQTAIDVTISGLSVGEHTIQAFHNYTFNDTDKLPTIGVKVDNELRQTGIVQTLRATTKHESATSYVKFNIQSEGDDVTITYFSEQTGDQYTTTRFLINAIEIDAGTSVGLSAWNPFPEDKDYHVDAENESVELTWTAAEGATSHIVYFGENEETVNNATEGVSQSGTSIIKTGLSPLKRYYWRVDEVIDGVTYKGDVWSFQPRRDAFPGAEGYGRYAIGGRGYEGNEGKVYHVTSLDDDATNPQPGTFRYGILKETGPRTIVFDVSGVIHLKDRLTCSDPYVTIAGQTAPGNGIMFRGAPLGVASDGITRFVRLRRGDIVEDGTTITITLEKDGKKYTKDVPADCGKGLDGMGMAGNDHSIIDHCSIGWTVDEAFSSRNAKNITLQKTLISEALNIAGHPNYDDGTGHGYAATVGGDKGSLHHNLLAHNAGRNWSMGGGLDKAGYYKDYLDMFNNVCYNWVDRTTDGGVHVGKFVNNYYKMGPASKKMQLIMAHLEKVGEGTQQYYVKGNIRENDGGSIISQSATLSPKGESGDEAIYTMRNDKGSSYTADAFFDSESWEHYFDSWATIETAKAAFKNVLSDVGCNYAGLDNHDVRMVSETLNGTTSTTGSEGKLPGIIDATTDNGCEGFASLNIKTAERPTGWDADKDGIPAWFEGAMGWSDAAANNNNDSDADYYTDLEEYLNWVAVPHFYNMANDGTVSALEAGTDHTITLADYFAGYTSPNYTVVSDGGATTSISDGVLTYNFPASSSKLATIQVKATQDGISLTRSFNFFIDASDVEEPEEPTVTPEGTAYTLAVSTNTKNNTTSSYEFKSEGVTFTVTNTNGKGYSEGSEDGVKYSAGVQYTITIPEGCSVNGIKFSGYNNDTGSDATININAQSYKNFVYPKRATTTNSEGQTVKGEYYLKSYTLEFDEPKTGSIEFYSEGAQCVWAITLYVTGTPAVTPPADDTEQAPAFPGAEGSGRYAQGGRGTDGTTNVYHVTSLKDDKNVEGTLRWALAQTGPRTIVFDVSGYIDLASDLKIPSNTTIAGQTAPAPGITLRYYTVNTSDAKNVIIRYMRFRRSQVKDVNDGADAVWGKHGNNIILDHCSFSWSIDEVASFYDNRDFTMQWCVVAEGLCNSGHTKGGHSYGGIWGGKNATFHHNMITNVQNRAPRLCGARYNWDGYDTETYANSVQAERVDVRNNLYYNWGNGNGAYGGMGGYHNLVNNYYKAGPGTKNKSRVFQGSANSSGNSNGVLPDGLPGRFYINGNYVKEQNAIYDWSGFIQDEGTGVNTTDLTYTDSQGLYGAAGATVSIKLDNEVEMADATTHTAANAYNQILLYGGASLYRDAVDERFMTDATNGTTSYQMTETTDGEGKTVKEFTKGIVDKVNDPAAAAVAGQPSFPMLAVVERPVSWDTDRDGMPDAWEDANGLDKNDAADGNLYTLDSEKTWYTNLEVYLNSIVEGITKAQTKGATIEIEEYYPTWTDPSAESLKEFVISNATHSYGSANVWTFSNGFGVTGQEGRTYASAGDYIKYSDGYEYTISVPSNVTVYKVKVEGYANAAVGTTSYLAAFGTQTFDATRYVFPSGNASVNRASYEFTLPTAVTGGTLKIQATGAQTCLIVTLYGEEKSYDLDEVANTMEEVADGESSVSANYTIDSSTYDKTNSTKTQYIFVSNSETFVMTRSSGNTKEDGDSKYGLANSIKYSNGQTFTISIPNGLTITNFKVTGYSNDSNEGSISKINGNSVSGYTFPARTTDTTKEQTKTYDIQMDVTDKLSFVPNKQCCFVITLTGTKTTGSKKTVVTLDEMATVHDLAAADDVTVKMKRGLTAGAWNTFCVPFSINKEQLQTALNDNNVEIVEYTSQEGTMLYFTDTDKIVAGKPYLIKPATFSRTYDECKTTPITFEGVNLEAANMKSNSREVASEVCPGVADYSFVGTYVRYIMETDGTELGLNSKNKLAKPAASTNVMRGLRAFFRYNAGNGAGAKVVINGTLTSIDEIDCGTAGAKGVYHVSGRYVRSEWNNGTELPRGLYIVNGQKMVK